MSAMDYRPLGSTGLQVSRIALGCGNFGGIGSAPEFFGQGESEDEAFAIMDAAFELGINVFDTADAYGGGRSETAIGRWLAPRGPAVRDQVLLEHEGLQPGRATGPNDRGLSRRALVRQVDASLQRLGAERLDLFLCHEPDPDDAARGDARARSTTSRRAGKLHYIGASNIEAWRLARALWISDVRGLARFEWVQNRLQPARPLARGRGAAAVRRSGPRLLAVLAARRRLADRQVPARRGAAGRLAHDAALRALRAPAATTRVFDALERLEAMARRARRRHGRARAGLAAAPRRCVNPIVVGPAPARAPRAGRSRRSS